MLKNIILHIGAGKCGSSALQEFLSNNPHQKSKNGSTIQYCCVMKDGEIVKGRKLKNEAEMSLSHYLSSLNFNKLNLIEFKNTFYRNLKRIKATTVVFSCEDWIFNAKDAEFFFSDLAPYSVTVVIYVRPPVQWLNSAWWQWGAWEKHAFKTWLSQATNYTKWADYAEAWNNLHFVNTTTVRIPKKDIVLDFLDFLDVDVSKVKSIESNRSLPSIVLRVFQRCPSLRPELHDSMIDFCLSRRLRTTGRPDWILSPENVSNIICETKSSNLALSKYMTERAFGEVRRSPAWWNVEFYNDKSVKNPEKAILSDGQLLSLLEDALNAVYTADAEIHGLKYQYRLQPRKLILRCLIEKVRHYFDEK